MTQLSDIAYVEMQYELKYFYGFHEQALPSSISIF